MLICLIIIDKNKEQKTIGTRKFYFFVETQKRKK